MKKRMIIMIIFLVIVFGGLLGFNIFRSIMLRQIFANFIPPPVTISATKAISKSWQPYLSAIGTLVAVNGVNISTPSAGIVKAIYFRSGQIVQKGQRIIKIDDKVELAVLKNNEAELKLAQLKFDRLSKLYKQRAASKSELDAAQAELTQSQAAVAKTKAFIEHKNITAPFTGKIGIRQVDIGEYVSPGITLVSLQSMNPMYIDFYLPENDLKNVYVDQAIVAQIDTYPRKRFYGKIIAYDAHVDVKTHNILVRASLPNNDGLLYPGLFTNIEVLLPRERHVVTVPQTSISYSLFGNSIFVIKQNGKDEKGPPILKVEQKYITLGKRRGDEVAILKGIKPGELVVTSGQLKLENGTRVTINNDVKL